MFNTHNNIFFPFIFRRINHDSPLFGKNTVKLFLVSLVFYSKVHSEQMTLQHVKCKHMLWQTWHSMFKGLIKMFLSKTKRKVDLKYISMRITISMSSLREIRLASNSEKVAILKEYNPMQHYSTKHAEQYAKYQ